MMHNAYILGTAAGATAVLYFTTALLVWRIDYARRTRARYGKGAND